MGQTASQIENHIDVQREDLSSNLRELENKVKAVADWRHQFENRPLVFIGAAFGGGLLLAKAIGSSGGRSRRHYSYGFPSPSPAVAEAHSIPRTPRAPSPSMDTAMRAWENIKGALVGVAATRVKDYVEEVLPGFSQQYQQAESQHRTVPSTH